MCINPKRILNKGYRDTSFLCPRYIDIPCGHCWQCKLNRINDVTFRIIQDVCKYDCPSCFVTLSYSDLFLPRLVYSDSEGFAHEISCWNREHIKRFLKRVRRKLHYYFGVTSQSFKYFLSCERGGHDSYISDSGQLRVATDRPHYHLFIYFLCDVNLSPCKPLPPDFLSSDFALESVSLLEAFWHYLINKEWYYGNVDLKYLYRDMVSSVKYVCKYICKDISEPLFNIQPKSVIRLIDPEFDIASDLWYIQLLPAEPWEDGVFTWAGHMYKVRPGFQRYPNGIKFTSLLPRCMGSTGIGMSFVEDKSLDELCEFLTGKRKVTLPSVHSSTLINLPTYYNRVLTHSSRVIPDDKFYLRTIVYPKATKACWLLNTRKRNVRIVWDNINGLHATSSKSLVTESSISDLGIYVQRYKFKNYVSNVKTSVLHYLSDSSFVYDSIRWYSSLPSEFHTDYFDTVVSVCAPYAGDSLSIAPQYISFKRVAKVLINSSSEKFIRSDSELFGLSCLINLVQLCQFRLSTLVHLANDKVFRDSFYSACSDNPDLFLTHSIT